jgi:hypothetical protein
MVGYVVLEYRATTGLFDGSFDGSVFDRRSFGAAGERPADYPYDHQHGRLFAVICAPSFVNATLDCMVAASAKPNAIYFSSTAANSWGLSAVTTPHARDRLLRGPVPCRSFQIVLGSAARGMIVFHLTKSRRTTLKESPPWLRSLRTWARNYYIENGVSS